MFEKKNGWHWVSSMQKITQLCYILGPVWKQSIFVVLEKKNTMVL